MPSIDEMNLSARARQAAEALLAEHPAIVFTSGRRDKVGQASAMASNVVKNRHWIEQTYLPSDGRDRLQAWLIANPGCVSRDQVAAGLLAVLETLSDDQLAHVSWHLSGKAFDVLPVDGEAGEAIKASIRALLGPGDRFLDHEGGLCRWHAQFA